MSTIKIASKNLKSLKYIVLKNTITDLSENKYQNPNNIIEVVINGIDTYYDKNGKQTLITDIAYTSLDEDVWGLLLKQYGENYEFKNNHIFLSKDEKSDKDKLKNIDNVSNSLLTENDERLRNDSII